MNKTDKLVNFSTKYITSTLHIIYQYEIYKISPIPTVSFDHKYFLDFLPTTGSRLAMLAHLPGTPGQSPRDRQLVYIPCSVQLLQALNLLLKQTSVFKKFSVSGTSE